MIFVGSDLGRIVALFPAEEVRPERGLPLKTSIELLAERYQFAGFPSLNDSVEKIENDGYKFQHGSFDFGDGEIAITDLSIFRDGVTVTAISTDFAERIWVDFVEWSQKELGLRNFVRPPQLLYLSQVNVIFENDVSSLFSMQNDLISKITNSMNNDTKRENSVYLATLKFGYDPEEISGIRPAPFLLERRVSKPYLENRYFSEGPFTTSAHVSLLREIEDLAS